MGRLSGRIALITGASRGIGAAVAKRFADEGAQVVLAGRDVKGLEKTDDAIRAMGGTATLAPLDLTQPALIEALAEQVAARFGRLDILVGNAGVLGELTPLADGAVSEWDNTLAINLTANWHLLRCFDGLLKASPAPRALFVTSGVTRNPHAYWGAYAVSKAALEAMVLTYASEHAKTALKANLIDPGAVRTRMRAQAFPGEDPQSLTEAERITELFVQLASIDCIENGRKFYAQ